MASWKLPQQKPSFSHLYTSFNWILQCVDNLQFVLKDIIQFEECFKWIATNNIWL